MKTLEAEIGEKLMNEFRGIVFMYNTNNINLDEFNNRFKELYQQALEVAANKDYVENRLVAHYGNVVLFKSKREVKNAT